MKRAWNKTIFGAQKMGPVIVLIILFLIGGILTVASQTQTRQYAESTVVIDEAFVGTPVPVYTASLRVDQILEVEAPVSNGTALLSLRWLNHTILWGEASSNPVLVFNVNGFSEYAVWLDSLATNTDITATIRVTTLEYPLVSLFPIGVILLLLGALLLLAIFPADIIRFRGGADPDEKIEKTVSLASQNPRVILGKIAPVLLLVAGFIFLLITDPGYVHNDSVGRGISGPSGVFDINWGYEAWGYLDFAQMVLTNLQAGDFSYLSWAAIHGSSKSIGLPILVGFFSFLTGSSVFLVYRTTVSIFSVILAGGVGLVSQTLTRSRNAFYIGSILTITNPILLEYSRSLYQEIPLCAMLVLSLYFLLRIPRGSRYAPVCAALFIGLAAAFKSILIIAPFFLALFIMLLLNTRSQYWDRRYFGHGFIFLIFLALSGLALHLLSYPLRWTDPIGKILGISQSAGWVASGELMILHNMGFFLFFLLFQTPLSVLVLLFLTPKYSGRYDVSIVRDLPLSLFMSYIPFYIIESRLIQHHMAYSLWPMMIAVTVTLCYILEISRMPRLNVEWRKAAKYGLVLLIGINILVIAPNAPYTGLHQNPMGFLLSRPDYFEPTYGLQEVSAVVSEYPDLGYLMTVRAPHVLSYYLPDRSIIIPPDYLEAQTTSLARLALMLSLPVDMVVLSEGYFEVFPGVQDWMRMVYSSGAFLRIGSFSSRGLELSEVYANRLLHDSLMGEDLLSGVTLSDDSPAGNLSVVESGVYGSFMYLANETSPGHVSALFNLPHPFSLSEAIFILHMNLSGDFSLLPIIKLTLRNATSSESMLLSPDVSLFSELSLACNFSAVGFDIVSYDQIEISIHDPPVTRDMSFNMELDRAELNYAAEGV